MRKVWFHALAGVLFLPILGGGKCVPYDPALEQAAALPSTHDCDAPGVARLVIQNFAYKIQCGCQETSGKVCTVPIGTTVMWQFGDATSHNVTAVADAFGGSATQLAGQHDHLFETAGTYTYGCTIHSYDMSGYKIVVDDS